MAANTLFTFQAIATEVAQNYGDTSDLTLSKAYKWVNRALIRVSEIGDFSWLWGPQGSFKTVVRFYYYQTVGTSPGVSQTISRNDNGTGGPSFNTAEIIDASTVITDVNGNGVFTAGIPVTATNTGTGVTLSSIPDAKYGACYMWYLYNGQGAQPPVNLAQPGQYVLTVATTNNVLPAQEIYSLAFGVKKVYAIYYVNNVRRKLRLMDNRRFREIFTYPVQPSGTPLYYRDLGRDSSGQMQVALWPLPNTVYNIFYDYVKECPLMVNASDDVRTVVGLPEWQVDALIQLATAIAFAELDASNYRDMMNEAVQRWADIYHDDSNQIDDSIRAASFDGERVDYADPVLPPQYTW